MKSLNDDALPDISSLPRFRGRGPGRKAFCHKCGFPWATGVGCAQCNSSAPERLSERTGKPVREKRKKGAPKADKRRRKYRNQIRANTIWKLAELVMALDAVLEYDELGEIAVYQDSLDGAGELKRRVREVMEDVQRAYELTKRYPTKTLAKIRKSYPKVLRLYS